MTKLEAIKYLVKHGYRGSEWEEAGMYTAVVRVLGTSGSISKEFCDKLLREAEEN